MKILFCYCIDSFPQSFSEKFKGKISNAKVKQTGFILNGSFFHPQQKLNSESNPFHEKNKNFESLLFIGLKRIQRISAYTLLESLWLKDQAKRTKQEDFPLLFQIVKLHNVPLLAIYNLNGTVGKNDFKSIVEALNFEYNSKSAVQPKFFLNKLIDSDNQKNILKAIKEEYEVQKDQLISQQSLNFQPTKSNQTKEEIILDQDQISYNELTGTEFLSYLSRKDLLRLQKAINSQLEKTKGLMQFI